MDEKVTEVILGMAKGRVKFQTNSGRSGSGKRASSELDVLRLVYAAKTLRGSGLKVHAYFAVLRDYEGRSTKETVETWLKKYDGSDCVQIVERTLNQQETTDLEKEKQDNAAAQERRGGNAKAGLAEKFAEDYLREYIKKSHPTAQPGATTTRPFEVDWDAWYVVTPMTKEIASTSATA